ncbi:MAG: putative sulfate exporter family transporter [Trueperaceae bacterium]|nr:putative sulfate exporter family transporter [Trueperaceae bacterium]MCC6310239.1 putative sulfate exporter family transporter [Trueperaceae bacterium]MCO5173239.1 putative sulfate exporter family transporter [Trueperaceae bacterium]MCW5818688.1 putative sulfate exporter family transporter [Trueperaceae bacterium]
MTAPAASGRLRSLLPGLALVVLLTFLAYELARIPGLKLLGPLVLALLAGALWRLARGGRVAGVAPGARFAAKVLLRLGIVLLGVRLDMRALAAVGPTVLVGSALGVLVAFAAIELVGRAWGVPKDLRRSLAVGTGVCGASAIAAALPVLKAEERHASLSVAVVSVVGTLGVVAFAAWDGLALVSSRLLAAIAGATLQEVGHVVAAGAAVGGGEGDLALLVKLSRVVLLAPVLMLLGWWLRREAVVAGASGGAGGPEVGAAPALGVARGAGAGAAAGTSPAAKLPPLVPAFVVGFLAMSAVTSLGWLGPETVRYLSLAGTLLTAAAMAGIGLGVQFRGLGRAGRQALVLGVVGFVAMLVVMSGYYLIALR